MTVRERPAPTAREAAEAWESLFRTQVTLMRRLLADDIWDELSMREYDVLFTLSGGAGSMRLRDLNENILMAQSSLSRLVDRLERRGLVRRESAPEDGRGVKVVLTDAGVGLQKEVGMRHVRSIAHYVGSAMRADDLATLRALLDKLRAAQSGVPDRSQVAS
ncbi:MarR family winged helix-turn-helix transcriptional regulator [Myceligenerans pegani]|uniref:Winged helix-turn-helix transcriptional regulator n=1 Tax=Myceligenerans pegani TaxID=2776917 RepID=A0ABR9MW44_9MICO|nr:MarR family winged helix-turn-helix transcriptional regulator [Myceligenerans sp. TRM 65318]MBE1875615.1 winged helix-turn-helix transcriptional regulator [Myceligenerans sp. TRM 65318]MBE3017886.1 winged helix-turn-helix transcriptional regulator [Myceligenerans sp. TRM 65318]